MLKIFLSAWNLFWGNHHVSLARMHDRRLKQVDPEWMKKLLYIT